MKLLILSGRSGSGKSVSIKILEDLGYYCVDNLPLALLPSLIDTLKTTHPLLAISVDARNVPLDPSRLKECLANLPSSNLYTKIIYLDAKDSVLLKRYSETRRKHPLSRQGVTLQEAIQLESRLMQPLANIADISIDTSSLSNHELYQLITQNITVNAQQILNIQIQSFGFKKGVPTDADFIFDVRCLPNPYWQPDLREKSGLDESVIAFLQQHASVNAYIEDVTKFLLNWIPKFIEDKRSYLTIAIGCTGGHHRSVFIAQQVKSNLEGKSYNVQSRHRDLV